MLFWTFVKTINQKEKEMAKKVSEDIILTGKAKEKEIADLRKKEWKFPGRSCTKCKLYKCFIGQESIKCDLAKYGCKSWDPIDE